MPEFPVLPHARRRRPLWTLLLAVPLLAAVGLVALTSAATPVPAAADDTVSFEDVGDQSYVEAVEAVAEAGIIVGCTGEAFCPDREVTRGQMATMLVETLGLEPLDDGPFTDTAGNTHEANINAIAHEDIVNGCEDGRFCPNDTITRAQMATMLARAFFLTPSEQTHFEDTTGVHGDNIERVADAGIAAGCGDPLTHFCARDAVLRWQAATFIARGLRLVDPVELPPLEERREQQAAIDAEREAERRAEEERLAAERRAAEDPFGIDQLSDARLARWERLAECESNGNWQAVSANGMYYGGLQFHPQTWRSVGGSGLPNQASKSEQIYRAEQLLKKSWATWGNQWPACSRMLGFS